MELNTLGDVVLFTQAAVTSVILLWLRRRIKSEPWRRFALAAPFILAVAWVLDHL